MRYTNPKFLCIVCLIARNGLCQNRSGVIYLQANMPVGGELQNAFGPRITAKSSRYFM